MRPPSWLSRRGGPEELHHFRGRKLEPLLASIHALNDELEVDPITTEDP